MGSRSYAQHFYQLRLPYTASSRKDRILATLIFLLEYVIVNVILGFIVFRFHLAFLRWHNRLRNISTLTEDDELMLAAKRTIMPNFVVFVLGLLQHFRVFM